MVLLPDSILKQLEAEKPKQETVWNLKSHFDRQHGNIRSFSFLCLTCFPDEGDRRLNVSVNNSTELKISWKDDLIKQFVCYSVEWRKKGHSALYKSFYENTNNYRHLSHLTGTSSLIQTKFVNTNCSTFFCFLQILLQRAEC